MSTKYPGGIITKNYTAPTPTSASGIWTLEQQEQAQQAGIWPYGGPFNYIEDVFSPYFYIGTGTTNTITNNINLSDNGGMVWFKSRSAVSNNILYDTARGAGKLIYSNLANAQATNLSGYDLTAFTTSGFTLGTSQNTGVNDNGGICNSWTFRKQPKFFDIVTYTGTGVARTVAHNLGSVPGCMIVKRTSTAKDWAVYHRSTGNTQYLTLNSTTSASTVVGYWNNTDPTSTVFTVGTDADVNANGETYVAYLFAHDAGGFGLTGTDNVISCGSWTNDGSGNADINLGYEPQWILIKPNVNANNWLVCDNMRGLPVGTGSQPTALLFPNVSDAEGFAGVVSPTATGFKSTGNIASAQYIYIAIRRGPMKVPTDGTTVFKPVTSSGPLGTAITTGFPVDLQIARNYGSSGNFIVTDRLRGVDTKNSSMNGPYVQTNSSAIVTSSTTSTNYWNSTGFFSPNLSGSSSTIYWNFGRAPKFMDVVAYTGSGSATTISHNLGAIPDMMWVKKLSPTGAASWAIYHTSTGPTGVTAFDSTTAVSYSGAWNYTAPTASVFSVDNSTVVNVSGNTYVWHGFATLPGVTKIASYIGTGAAQNIDCGFTSGARFVLIRRVDSGGPWYVFDTARGISVGAAPYLQLETSTSGQQSSTYIAPYSPGFTITSAAPTNINALNGVFIYMAIA